MKPKKSVLVFDDDPSLVLILKYIFDEMGWDMHSSSNSNEVVEKVRELQPAIIMMDNNIPDYGGVTATRQIKSQQDLEHIPVIFFSAHSDIQNLADQAGADAYLPKPFGLTNLAEVVTRLSPEPCDQDQPNQIK
jgi:CheY-like chemotaxis protein